MYSVWIIVCSGNRAKEPPMGRNDAIFKRLLKGLRISKLKSNGSEQPGQFIEQLLIDCAGPQIVKSWLCLSEPVTARCITFLLRTLKQWIRGTLDYSTLRINISTCRHQQGEGIGESFGKSELYFVRYGPLFENVDCLSRRGNGKWRGKNRMVDVHQDFFLPLWWPYNINCVTIKYWFYGTSSSSTYWYWLTFDVL